MIASRVIRLTLGCVSKCNELERCLEEPCDIKIVPNPTTTSTSTFPPSTTTSTSSTSSTTTTSTTVVPSTTTTSSSSSTTTTTTTTGVGPTINAEYSTNACTPSGGFQTVTIMNGTSLCDPAIYLVSTFNMLPNQFYLTYQGFSRLFEKDITNQFAYPQGNCIDCSITTTTTSSSSTSTTTSSTTTICQDCIAHDVTIGTQVWSGCNLDVTTYRNGDPIPEVTDQGAWNSLTTGAWCYYENTSSNGTTYGKLYNWHAVNDPRGLAPSGYHIPTDEEWTTLVNYLGGDNVAGGHLKEPGFCHWESPNSDADNSSNFTGLPSGNRGLLLINAFTGITLFTYFWTSTPYLGGADGYAYQLRFVDGLVVRGFFTVRNGFAVRLIKDTEPTTTTTTSSSSTTTTTTTCNVSSVHPYNYQLIAGTQGAFSSPNFIGSFTEACASQACLTAGTCFEYLGFATRFDASPAEIGMVSYLEPTGCVERPLDDGYYIFNYGGTNFVIGQIIDNTIVDFPICPTTTTTSTSSSTTTSTTTLPPTTTTTSSSSTTTTTTTVPLVTICSQIWTLENLDVETYRNGDVIPQVTDPIAWENLTTGAWCYYNNDSANGPIYGKLYNWYAVTDPRGLAPIGYHVPTDAEFETLIVTCLGGETIAGGKMKSTGTTLWNSPNTDATNSSGFTGLPAGSRNYDGQFLSINDSAAWWTSTPNVPPGNPLTARSKYVVSNFGFAYNLNTTKTTGLSVRLIKD
jgi:uncharacterized protein (TIGR02145 family)